MAGHSWSAERRARPHALSDYTPMRTAEVVFWFSVAGFVYAYAGYPVLVWVLAQLRPARGSVELSSVGAVSVVIAAHNESDVIADRVANILGGELPQTGVEIIVASDGSTDGTSRAAIVAGERRVWAVDLPRGGRARAHNAAVAVASGEIVVFTDARTAFDRGCLVHLAQAFTDPRVGCAVGRLIYERRSGTVGEQTAAYWQLETLLRRWASDAGVLAVGTGCCMAIRKALYRALQPDEDVDDATPLDVLLQGSRVVFVPEAVALDEPADRPGDEIRARARMTVLAMTAILHRARLLNPFAYPWIALALWSHRILRSLTPVWVLGVMGGAVTLVGHPFYRYVVAAQLLVCVLGVVGWAAGFGAGPAVLRVPLSFTVWNIGFALGLLNVLWGRRVSAYAPVAAAWRRDGEA